METEYDQKKKPLVSLENAPLQSFFWKSYIEFYSDNSEITLNELLHFLLKMTYVQAINLIFVYIIAFLTYYLGSLQTLLINNNNDYLYLAFLVSMVILFYIITFTRKIKNITFQLSLFILLSIVVIILFGNILGLIVFYSESTVMLLVYIILTGCAMLISFILVLKMVSPKKFTFEKMVAISTIVQLILFLIFISIYSEEWIFILSTWLYHYIYCVCFTYQLIQISTGKNTMFKIKENRPVEYLMSGLYIYIYSTCLSISFVPIILIYFLIDSIGILWCKTDEKYFD